MAAMGAAVSEDLWYEIAELYDKDYEKLDQGEPCALFNFIRLSNLYAVACICYYEHHFSPLEDYVFDELCKYLLEFFDEAIASGVWGGVLEKEMLRAGSGYHCKGFRLPLHNIAYCVQEVTNRRKYVEKST